MAPSEKSRRQQRVVGPGRLELPTPRLSSVCSNQLSYGPSPAAHFFARDKSLRWSRAAHRNWARNPAPLPGHLEEAPAGERSRKRNGDGGETAISFRRDVDPIRRSEPSVRLLRELAKRSETSQSRASLERR